jgi:hypothetical protein
MTVVRAGKDISGRLVLWPYGWFTGRGGGWYPGGARGVGCLTGGGTEANGFPCGQQHDVMAGLRCSRTTATAVVGAVGNVRSSGRGKQRGEQTGAGAWRLSRKRRGTGLLRGCYAG